MRWLRLKPGEEDWGSAIPSGSAPHQSGTDILRNFALVILRRQAHMDSTQHFNRCHRRQCKEDRGRRTSYLRPFRRRGFRRCATLVDRALHDGKNPSRLTCVFVNNACCARTSSEKVQQNLRDKLGLHVIAVDATERFLNKLAGVTDPEKKRKIIATNSSRYLHDNKPHRIEKQGGKRSNWLVQGTLYPDVSNHVPCGAHPRPLRSTTMSADYPTR